MSILIPKTTTAGLFYNGLAASEATVSGVVNVDEAIMVFTDKSPFHPEDYLGGDQPGDKGVILIDGDEFRISDTHTMIVDMNTGEMVFPETKRDMNAGVQNGRYGILAGHVIGSSGSYDSVALNSALSGKICTLRVDDQSRQTLNRVHSSVHLMSFVLNEYMKPLWKKSVASVDDMGNPNFDMMAIEKSIVSVDGGIDSYRMGRSLRKSGFDAEELMGRDDVEVSAALTQSINDLIIGNGENAIDMTGDSTNLGLRRFWQTVLRGNPVSIPCGGTHVGKVGDIGSVKISVQILKEEKTLIVKTTLV